MIWLAIIPATVLILFIAGACRVSGRADEASDDALRQLAHGDAAPLPTIDRLQGD